MKVNSQHLAIAKVAFNNKHEQLNALRVERGGVLVATNGHVLVEVQVAGEEASTVEGTLRPSDVLSARSLQITADLEREVRHENYWYLDADHCGCDHRPLEFQLSQQEDGALELTTVRGAQAGQLRVSSPRTDFPDWRPALELAGEPKATARLDMDLVSALAELIQSTGCDAVEVFMRGPKDGIELRWESDGKYRAVLMPMLPRAEEEELYRRRLGEITKAE